MASAGGELYGRGDCIIRLWDIVSGKEIRRLEGCKQAIKTIAFSPCGSFLASGEVNPKRGGDCSIKLWDLLSETEEISKRGEKGDDNLTTLLNDGKYLAQLHADNTIKIWDTASGLLKFMLKTKF